MDPKFTTAELYKRCIAALNPEKEDVVYWDAHYLHGTTEAFGPFKVDNYPDCYNSNVPDGVTTERDREILRRTGHSCLAVTFEEHYKTMSCLILRLRDLVDGIKSPVLQALARAGADVTEDDVIIVNGLPFTFIEDPSAVDWLQALYEQLA